VSLAEVKETAKHLGATFNDMVLAVAAGSLRELLLRYDGRPDRPIQSSVPVSTDKSPDRATRSEVFPCPYRCISMTRSSGSASSRAPLPSPKKDQALVGPQLYGRVMAYLPTAFAPKMFRWQAIRADKNSMKGPVSNVAGPRERGNFGGATVSEIYSTGILSPGVGINITVWGYADQVNISVLADDRTFGDVHEATDAMLHAFAEIRSAAGFPAELARVETAMPIAVAL
jgi:diacylglycerol O-acyltransferase / wax synthase